MATRTFVLCLCILLSSPCSRTLKPGHFFKLWIYTSKKPFSSVFDKLYHSNLCLLLQTGQCPIFCLWGGTKYPIIQKTKPKIPVTPIWFSLSEIQRCELFLANQVSWVQKGHQSCIFQQILGEKESNNSETTSGSGGRGNIFTKTKSHCFKDYVKSFCLW